MTRPTSVNEVVLIISRSFTDDARRASLLLSRMLKSHRPSPIAATHDDVVIDDDEPKLPAV
eukprot:12034377-Heterocapsa_arctica.AAC.1